MFNYSYWVKALTSPEPSDHPDREKLLYDLIDKYPSQFVEAAIDYILSQGLADEWRERCLEVGDPIESACALFRAYLKELVKERRE